MPEFVEYYDAFLSSRRCRTTRRHSTRYVERFEKTLALCAYYASNAPTFRATGTKRTESSNYL